MISKKSLTSGTLMSVFFNAGAKVLQFLSIFLVGIFFGTGVNTDLYYFLYTFVTVIIAGFIGGIDSTIVVPEFIRLREQEGDKQAMGFVNKYIAIYLGIGFLLTIYGFINPVSYYGFFSNFNQSVLVTNKPMLIISLVLLVVILVTNLLSNVLTSYKYFGVSNSFILFNNLLSLIFLLIFYKSHGILSVLAGITIGYFFNLIFLVIILVKKLHWNFFIINRSVSKRIIKYTGTNQVIALIVACRSYFIQYLLSGLSSGVLTAVGWGNQFASLADSFLNVQFYTITGVRFSEYFALRQPQSALRLFYTVFNLLFLIGVIVFLLLFTCSDSIVTIINLKHTITPDSVSVLSNSMVYLSLVPLINILNFLFARLLVSFQLLNSSFLLYSIFSQLAILILSWVGIYWFGYKGYILASIIGFAIIAVFNFFLVKKHFAEISLRKIFETTYFTLFIAGIVIGVSLLIKSSFKSYQVSNPFIAATIVTIVLTLLFFKKIRNTLIAFNSNVH